MTQFKRTMCRGLSCRLSSTTAALCLLLSLTACDGQDTMSDSSPDQAHDAAPGKDVAGSDRSTDAPQSDGAPAAKCKSNSDCKTGWCVDGHCCDKRCEGSCMGCNVPNKEGTCSPVAAGKGAPGCTGSFACDGKGKCLLANGVICAKGNVCASGHCKDGVCCDSACAAPCNSCSTGTCVAVKGKNDPPECHQLKTCDKSGACVKQIGATCSSATECISGFCKDGKCCNAACTKPCFSCALGVCLPVNNAQDTPECSGGTKRCCAQGCTDTSTDGKHCGRCGWVCPAGSTCQSGVCKCSGGKTLCGFACVDLQTSKNHCGRCYGPCPWGTCCSGKCISLKTDSSNCGSCGNACASHLTCISSTCACAGGKTECNSSCVDPASDAKHCGKCGNACDATKGFSCIAGSCGCAVGRMTCGSLCVDGSTDSKHCGKCNNACGAGKACCKGRCVDLLTDSQNCSTCGSSCPAGISCVAGKCDCGAGQSVCSSTCVALQTDSSNCGTCGTKCSGLKDRCVAGSCVCGSPATTCGKEADRCTSGQCRCGSAPPCSFTSDTCTKGVCGCGAGKACPTGQVCSGGTCQGCTSSTQCDDNNACTTDSCASGVCTHTLASNSCVVSGVCAKSGEPGPTNNCLVCKPSVSTSAWTRDDSLCTCTHAKLIKLVNGKATIKGSTVGNGNEFGNQIRCTLPPYRSLRGPQVFYKVNMKKGQAYKISLNYNIPAPYFYIFKSGCTPQAINADCSSNGVNGLLAATSATFTPQSSGTYYIGVTNTFLNHGAFTLTINEYNPSSNALCASPKVLTLVNGKVGVGGNTSGLKNEFGKAITCGAVASYYGLNGPQLYYSVNLSASKKYKITLNTSFFTHIYLFRNGCLPQDINNDCSGKSGNGAYKKVYHYAPGYLFFQPNKSGMHHIAVDGSGSSWTSGSFWMAVEEWQDKANRTCSGAEAVSLPATIHGDTVGATNEFGKDITCGLSTDVMEGNQLYYKANLTAGKTYTMRLSINFRGGFGVLYLFSGSCTAADINKDCSSKGKTGAVLKAYAGKPATLTFTPTKSGTYFFAVDSTSSIHYYGAFSLTVQ